MFQTHPSALRFSPLKVKLFTPTPPTPTSEFSAHSLLLRLAAPSPDRHRLAVLVETPSAAVDVGVGGRCHGLLSGSDGFG